MFYTRYDDYEGIPTRLYREPCEIIQDIREIKGKIKSLSEMLNIRNMLTDIISKYAEGEPEKWLNELRILVEQADETLEEITSLRDNLGLLQDELEDTRCALAV